MSQKVVVTKDMLAYFKAKLDLTFSKFSGKYDDLTNKPTIPSKTSQLENDAGFITEAEAGSNYTLTQDATDGHKLTFTKEGGSSTTITIPDNNTTYSKVSEFTNDNKYATRLWIDGNLTDNIVEVGTLAIKNGIDGDVEVFDTNFEVRGFGRTHVAQYAGNFLDITTPEYDAATTTDNGLMSSADKVKLNGIADGANKVTKVSELTNDSDFITSTEVAGLISSVYKPAGSVAFESLPTLSKSVVGNVYNVTNGFTTTDSFVEGAGNFYPAGTNVVIIESNESYLYDVLSGFVDLSSYVKTDDLVEITSDEIDAMFG